MKLILSVIFYLSIISSLSSQSFVTKKGIEHLWGTVEVDQLKEGKYKEWYDKNLEDFETKLTEKDGDLLDGIQVKIFIGTWCGDTKYLVPKFIKSWEAMGLDKADLEIIALHRDDELYKQGPNNETRGLNIHRVPTFIFEKADKEIGRIVERTVFDLDTDIKTIASGGAYEERYQAVKMIDDYLSEVDMDSLLVKSTLNKAYRMVRREVSTISDLNTYAIVLFTEGRNDEAEFVFKLNRYLFPYNPRSRDSYGEILLENGKFEEAKVEFLETLRLRPESNNAIAQLSIINEELAAIKDIE